MTLDQTPCNRRNRIQCCTICDKTHRSGHTWVLQYGYGLPVGQGVPVMQLRAGDEEGGLHPQHEGQLGQGGLLIVRGHVRHQRQVLDQPTALALRRVSWTQHAPLTRLKSPRPTHLHHKVKESGGVTVMACTIAHHDICSEMCLLCCCQAVVLVLN